MLAKILLFVALACYIVVPSLSHPLPKKGTKVVAESDNTTENKENVDIDMVYAEDGKAVADIMSGEENAEKEENEEDGADNGDEDNEMDEDARAFETAKKLFNKAKELINKYGSPLWKRAKNAFGPVVKKILKALFQKLMTYLEGLLIQGLEELGFNAEDLKEIKAAILDNKGVDKIFEGEAAKDIKDSDKEKIIEELNKATSDDPEEVEKFNKEIGEKIPELEKDAGLNPGDVLAGNEILKEVIDKAGEIGIGKKMTDKEKADANKAVSGQIAAAVATELLVKVKRKKAAKRQHGKRQGRNISADAYFNVGSDHVSYHF